MHRFALLLSVVAMVLVGAVSTSAPSAVIAQEATPDAAAPIPALLVAWAEAWSSGDPDQLAALYAPDAVYEEIPTDVVVQGPDEIRAFVAETHGAFSDIQVTPRSGFQADNWAVLEADFSGRAADGASFSVPFIVVFELEGDMIVRNADYFDLYDLMGQLGMLPTAEAATPTANTSISTRGAA